ncbi:FHA domain-containing protein [Nannocystaceae bacterium ST9]
MTKCLSCGSLNEPSSAFCATCGAAFEHPLCLIAEGGRGFSFSIDFRVNQAWAAALGEDGRLWDRSWQMQFIKRENRWYVVPNPRAVNDTLLNGELLTTEAPLHVGDVVAVGRASKKIVKTPLQVERPDLYAMRESG